MRGNLHHLRAGHSDAGSIPACAGEPPHRIGFGAASRVYPRVCGGTFGSYTRCRGSCGLSPRVRGNLIGSVQMTLSEGSIPACAGEPSRAHGSRTPPPLYPRVCGGTLHTEVREMTNYGLSPRVRGNHQVVWGRTGGVGSIPACAGEPTRYTRG